MSNASAVTQKAIVYHLFLCTKPIKAKKQGGGEEIVMCLMKSNAFRTNGRN